MDTIDSKRSDYRIFQTVTTRWMDNDAYGHVNNAVYYSYFDTAVNAYLMTATGTDTRRLDAIGLVAETSCRFLRSLSFPEPVHAGLRLEKLGNSSVIYRIGLFGGDASEPSAIGRFVHVYVNASSRTVVPVPEVIRRAVEQLR
jgi:acyl-CoA thioester hydrolase